MEEELVADLEFLGEQGRNADDEFMNKERSCEALCKVKGELLQKSNTFEAMRMELRPRKDQRVVEREVKTETINYRTLNRKRKDCSCEDFRTDKGLGM